MYSNTMCAQDEDRMKEIKASCFSAPTRYHLLPIRMEHGMRTKGWLVIKESQSSAAYTQILRPLSEQLTRHDHQGSFQNIRRYPQPQASVFLL